MTAPVGLAISPHLDDAAFSCGGTLAHLALSGWRIVVATVFTQSVPNPTGFALACQLDKGLSADIDYMALRREEDRAAMAELGCTPEWLDLPEAPHRGYGPAPALFDAPREDDAVVPLIRDVIGSLLARHRPTLVLAPQAIGGHVDHVQVVRAVQSEVQRVPVAWWEDFPYVARTGAPARPFREQFEALIMQDVLLAERDRIAKQAACLAYASQIGFQFGGAHELEASLASRSARERFREASIG